MKKPMERMNFSPWVFILGEHLNPLASPVQRCIIKWNIHSDSLIPLNMKENEHG